MIDPDPVVIEDDNDVIFLKDSNDGSTQYKPSCDIIVIDDVDDLTQNTIPDIIQIVDEPELKNKNNLLTHLCDKVYKENRNLRILVEKSLEIENTDRMLRILNRSLLCGYKKTTEKFKKSAEIEETLLKAIKLIVTDPDRKYYHVKNVCEVFRKHRFKKKVDLMPSLLKGTVINKLKRMERQRDERNIFEVPIINLDEDVTLSYKPIETDQILELEDFDNDFYNKENSLQCEELKANPCEVNKNIESSSNRNMNSLSAVNSISNLQSISFVSLDQEKDVPNEFLLPQRVEVYGADDSENMMGKVKDIEDSIAFLKTTVAHLEEEEVVNDILNSPYNKCANLKAEITKHYKELCLLTDEEPVKRHEVRFNVDNGHPYGPVRELEKFINDHIGSDGEPPFPDHCDVVDCVAIANENDNLGWTRQQILGEANQLFVQCGNALKKRRQRREWRDMLGRVKQKNLDCDPASEDPILQVKLEQNKRIALEKEEDLLQRFATMESLIPMIPDPNLTIENDSENEEQETKQDILLATISEAPLISETSSVSGTSKISETPMISVAPSDPETSKISETPWITETSRISESPRFSESPMVFDAPMITKEPRISESPNNVNVIKKTNGASPCLVYTHRVSEDCSNVNTDYYQKRRDSIMAKPDVNSKSSDNDMLKIKVPEEDTFLKNCILTNIDTNALEPSKKEEEMKVNVKPEPEDIPMLLAELGDSYTSTIIDIEDPFLVVEISSESSDGESDNELTDHRSLLTLGTPEI